MVIILILLFTYHLFSFDVFNPLDLIFKDLIASISFNPLFYTMQYYHDAVGTYECM